MSRAVVWAAAGAAVALGLALALFDPYLFTGGDNAAYYALTKSLATGRGYVDIIEPGAPKETVYPPGYPALLTPFYIVSGGRLVVLKLQSVLAAAVALVAIYGLTRRDQTIPDWVAVAAVWLVGLYPVFIEYTKWVLSDMSFTAVGLVSLYAFTRASGEEPDDDSTRWWIAGCLVALFGFYVRTAGVTLLAAALAWAVLQRRWGWGMVAAITGVGALPWVLWSTINSPASGGYIDQLTSANRLDPESATVSSGDVVQRAADTALHYLEIEFPRLFWPDQPVPLLLTIMVVIFGSVILGLGAWRVLREGQVKVWHLYLILTLGLLAVWPWTGDRFFLTVVPLLWIMMLKGLDWSSRAVTGSARVAQIAVATLAVVLLVGTARSVPAQWQLLQAYLDGDQFAGYDEFWQEYFQASLWTGENAPDAIITSRKPTLVWYWSQRPTVVYPFHGDEERTWQFLRDRDVTHIVLDPYTRAFLSPTLERHLDELDVIHMSPKRTVAVLAVRPEP